MRKFLLKFVLAILLMLPLSASAHQPRYVGNSTSTVVTNPEISQAFYGVLEGSPSVYTVSSQVPFNLYVNVLVPKMLGSQKSVSFIVNKGNERIVSKDGTKFAWTEYYEDYMGDWYYKGPEFSQQVPAGTYKIEVLNPANVGKYVAVFGQQEKFPFSEMMNSIFILPTLKLSFFNVPVWLMFNNKIGSWLLAVLSVLFLLIGMFRRPIMNHYKTWIWRSKKPAVANLSTPRRGKKKR